MAAHKNHKEAARHHHAEKHPHHHAKHTPSHKPKTMVWIIGGILLAGLAYILMNYSVAGSNMGKDNQTSPTATPSSISSEERKRIDQWIIDSSLNVYGDKKGTVYIGGTPLFNEMTGKYTDLYEYILKKHPDRPWNT